jgi:ATP-dependent Clp protease ATP-binding subunit ClpA
MDLTEEARALLAKEGYSEEYGARPLKRVIQNRIEDPLSDAILANSFAQGSKLIVDVERGDFSIRGTEDAETEPAREPVPA